jgi:hypothetical protein
MATPKDQIGLASGALMPGDVPAPITEFVRAVNESDEAELVRMFAPDALVNDQLRDFWGHDAIKAWIRNEVVHDRLQLKVVMVVRHFQDYVMTAHVDGDFDKTGLPDPLAVNLYFTLHQGRIARLILLNNRPDDSAPEVRTARP